MSGDRFPCFPCPNIPGALLASDGDFVRDLWSMYESSAGRGRP